MKMSALDWVAMILVLIGGINWGLVGFFKYDLVKSLFGDGNFTRVVFGLVGLAALWVLYMMSMRKSA